MVLVFAAGNSGLYSPGVAKNVFTVGAAENVQAIGGTDASGISDDPADNANDVVGAFGRGPCADGRHKTDLVAPRTHVSGGVAPAPQPRTDRTARPPFRYTGRGG